MAERVPTACLTLIMEFVEGIPPNDYCRNQNLSIHQRLDPFRKILFRGALRTSEHGDSSRS